MIARPLIGFAPLETGHGPEEGVLVGRSSERGSPRFSLPAGRDAFSIDRPASGRHTPPRGFVRCIT